MKLIAAFSSLVGVSLAFFSGNLDTQNHGSCKSSKGFFSRDIDKKNDFLSNEKTDFNRGD